MSVHWQWLRKTFSGKPLALAFDAAMFLMCLGSKPVIFAPMYDNFTMLLNRSAERALNFVRPSASFDNLSDTNTANDGGTWGPRLQAAIPCRPVAIYSNRANFENFSIYTATAKWWTWFVSININRGIELRINRYCLYKICTIGNLKYNIHYQLIRINTGS